MNISLYYVLNIMFRNDVCLLCLLTLIESQKLSGTEQFQ